MSDKHNCLNCSVLDKEKRCCSQDADKTKKENYELEACWCNLYRESEADSNENSL